MTAEVVILNRNGVGIAADSVVTLTGLNTPNAVKTYHTQNKLFGLSASEAVAVMVYGNCYFGSFPWETIIKEFRNNHQPQSTIDKYGEELISYLVGLVDKSPMMFADDVVMRVARYELSSLRWRVNQARKGAAVQSLIFPEYDVQMAILTILRERLRALEAEPSLRLSEVEADRYVTDSVLTGDSWRKLLDEELFELPISDDISNEAIELVKLSLRKTTGIPSSTGVVLAGFGCDEMLPSCTHYWMDGVDMAGLRYAHLSTKHVDDQHDVWILPYAQTEVIDTYLRGMNPRIEAYLGTLVRGYIKSELRIELESMMSEISIDDPEAGDVVSSVMTDRIVDDVVNNVTVQFRG